MSSMRLNKFLAHGGIASRRKVEDLIFAKMVRINGKVIDHPGTMVDPNKDSVTVNGKIVKPEQKKYFILNKPKGFICSNTKKTRERLVVDLFKDQHSKLFTVGRLDRDTTGLIIVTNDGDLANKIIHPSSNLEKEYLAKVKEAVSHDHLVKISKGAFVENKFVKPIKVTKVRRGTLKIIVKEGKKREVKAFILNAKLSLLELTRIRIGNLMLGSINEGFYKRSTLEELSKIFSK